MNIGILGAGAIGKAFAGHLAKAGYDVLISNSRGPESLAAYVRELGPTAKAVTTEEAARADVVVLAVPWAQIQGVLDALPAWDGRILIDPSNAFILPDFRFADLGGSTSSQIVASHAPGARVVKAGNTLPAALLAADPKEASGRRVLFISGDDEAAKMTVKEILEKVGFAIIDLGGLATGGKVQQADGPLASLNLIKLG